jgi:hypothetical protein
MENASLIQVLLLFYLIIMNNHANNTLSKQMKEYLASNKLAQHFVGFTILLVLFMNFANVTKIEHGIIYASLAYMWFVFSTKLDLQWNIIILSILVVGYIAHHKFQELTSYVNQDKILSDEQKQKIIDKYFYYEMGFIIACSLITVCGTLFYIDKKTVQYGGNFSFEKFIV